MLIGSNKKLHFGIALLAGALVIGAAIWHWFVSQSSDRWAGGSSFVGLVLGSIAAGIILFELLLWPRKRLRRRRLVPTRFWLAAHLWFGLATGPLAYIHAGYRFGGTFTSVLMSLLLFVLLSGIYGWIMQLVIPKWMLGNLPAETITAQIEDVSIQNALDARRMITVAYGPKPERLYKLTNLEEHSLRFKGNRTKRAPDTDQDLQKVNYSQKVIGAVQRRGLPRSRTSLDTIAELDPTDARTIWKEYAAVIEPYLLGIVPRASEPEESEPKESVPEPSKSLESVPNESKPKGSAPINVERPKIDTTQKSLAFFQLLRESCSPSASTILNRLEGLCEQRQQFVLQRKAQFWLHSWIAVHASASVVLGVLLVAHIFLALKYR